MTKKVPVILEDSNIQEVEALLLKKSKRFETINYIYTVDKKGILKGAVSIKEVFRAPKSTVLKSLVRQPLVTVPPHTHQKRVCQLALSHNLKAVPVVDKAGKFLGTVSSDTILYILDREAGENLFRFGGVHREAVENVESLPLLTSLGHRLPWLLIGLLGGILAAGIVGFFEETLSENIILAAFIPLIVYMADAVGTQMEAFIIRDFALDAEIKFSHYFFRHFIVVGLLAVISSVLLSILSFILYGEFFVSLVLAASLFIAIMTSMVTGLVIPYTFGKFGFDPADASGPIATIIQDLLSILVYFSIAKWLL